LHFTRVNSDPDEIDGLLGVIDKVGLEPFFSRMYSRGLQFYTFFGISIGIGLIDIGKKIAFYFLQNVRKCTVFFAFAF
jgi:hypothetical protein